MLKKVLVAEKNCKASSGIRRRMITVLCLANNYKEAITCAQAFYRDAISMTDCSTIPGVYFVLFHLSGA